MIGISYLKKSIITPIFYKARKRLSNVNLFLITMIVFSVLTTRADNPHLFSTSKCLDLLCSFQYYDKIKSCPLFLDLQNDSTFVRAIDRINSRTRASKLCNAYVKYGTNLNDADSCLFFIENILSFIPESEKQTEWIGNIIDIQEELCYVAKRLVKNGYCEYWDSIVNPALQKQIETYYSSIPDGLLEAIHSELRDFAEPEILTKSHSKTYIVDIDNAFNLDDESFCCTPFLLDPELEQKYHLDFLKVYIHENLHRLEMSQELMDLLNTLLQDDFYREKEKIAAKHNEGQNEAFVVAAEVFLSNKLGRRNSLDVYNEFLEYVDGSLVLAPIIYIYLRERATNEIFNDFIIRLFKEGKIKIGSVKTEYDKAMRQLKENASL